MGQAYEAHITPEVKPVTSLLLSPLLKDPKFIAAILGVASLLILFTLLRPGKSVSRRSGAAKVLLVGPSDGGKTALFSKLVHGTYTQTHTSIVPSATTFNLLNGSEQRQLRLVDLPGHPRLRDEFQKYFNDAAAVVFVVDIVGLVRNAASVAEQLPPILTALANLSSKASAAYAPPKIILLAHKSDLLIRPSPPSSPSPPNIPETTVQTAKERLKSILTREMERLKAARGSGGVGGRIEGMSKVAGSGGGGWFGRLFGGGSTVESGGEEDEEGLIWGGKGEFRWEDIEGVEIEWVVSGLGAVSDKSVAEVEEGNGLDELKEILVGL